MCSVLRLNKGSRNKKEVNPMELIQRIKKEVNQLETQINKLEQETAEKKQRKKSLEKALKELVPVAETKTVSQVR